MKQLTKTQATKALAKINAVLAPFGVEAILQEPGFQAEGWAVVSEEAPYDWPWLLTSGDTDEFGLKWPMLTFDKVVFAEPINSWALGLYKEGS